MQKKNNRNSQGIPKYREIIILPPKIEKNTETKTNKAEKYFNNIINNMPLGNLDISSIKKNSQSSPKIDNLEEIEFKNFFNRTNKIYKRTLHIVMLTHEHYLHNLLYLLGENGLKYKYYFVYVKEGDRFYIQFSPKNAKCLSLQNLAPCTFLEPLDYDEFMVLLEEKAILDIKIAISNPFLVLKERGKLKNREKIKLNKALIQYCVPLKIDYHFNDMTKEGEEEI